MEMSYVLVGLPLSGLRESQGFISHNPGGVQTTQTDRFAQEHWAKKLYPTDNRHWSIPRRHYRLVTRGAGFGLSTFKGTRELLSATYDIFIGKVSVCHHISPPLSASHLSCDGCALKSQHPPPGPQPWQYHTLQNT